MTFKTKSVEEREALLDAIAARGAQVKSQAKVRIQRTARGERGVPVRQEQAAKAGKVMADTPFNFEIRGPNHPDVLAGKYQVDDRLVVRLKELLNASGLCRRDLFLFVGDGPNALFADRNAAYNLDYGLRYRGTITFDCADRWLHVLGLELQLVYQPLDSNAHNYLLELRQAILDGEDLLMLQDMAAAISVD
jgi:hypothetical protein